MTYEALFRAPGARHGELVAELWVAGTLGVEERGDEVHAYFERPPADLEALAGRAGAILLRVGEVHDRDWIAEYRRRVRPLEIGPFWIDPREPGEEAAPDGMLPLRVPARNAFGTGSHASTALVLDWLPRLGVSGLRVVDVGCGSGILSFAALELGAAMAVGLDLDVGSAVTASLYTSLNRHRPSWLAATAGALDATFDLALVNILPERWLDQAGEVVRLVRPGGGLVTSGLLTEQAGEVGDRLAEHGLLMLEQRDREEWSALLLVQPGS